MESYSAAKRTEVMKFVSKWTELENITPSEVSQTQRDVACSHVLIHMWTLPSNP